VARVFAAKSNGGILAGVLFAIFIWGGNNAAVKFTVTHWPPSFLACTRFAAAGVLMLGLLRWTAWLGRATRLTAALKRDLWWRGGLGIAAYVLAFNYALVFTSASNAALYIGTAPVWALVWEERPRWHWRSGQRYGAALLALTGVVVLFWPALNFRSNQWLGDLLALTASILWTNYGRQCRRLGERLSGAEMTAHNMWRAALMLAPFAALEVATKGISWRGDLAVAHSYTILFGVVVAFALWSNALRHWPTSKVYLFNNLIPLSTVLWAHTTLNEPISPNFWLAMLLIVAGVLLGQANLARALGNRWLPAE
jgi:drug/metabolite transporter (DMT)-like permease